MTSRTRVTEYRPNRVTPSLGQRLDAIRRSVRKNMGVPLDVNKPNMVFEERDRIDRGLLVDQHNILAVSMCFSSWKT